MGATTQDKSATFARRDARQPDGLALVVCWSREEPGRVGELVWFGPDARVGTIGREGDVAWIRQRPGMNEARAPLGGTKLSRHHLRVERVGAALSLENIGRRPLLVRGNETIQVVARPGDVVAIEGVLVLACVVRPELIPATRHAEVGAFGAPDAWGVVGESPATWALREAIAFAKKTGGSVAVRGGPGSGRTRIADALGGDAASDAHEAPRHLIDVPPLIERREDIPLIADMLLREAITSADLTLDIVPRLGPRAIESAVQLADGRMLEATVWRALREAHDGWAELAVGTAPEPEHGVDREHEAGPEPETLTPMARADVPPSVLEGLASLTRAERTVLGHLTKNMTSRAIAQALFVSVRTVQNHRARICDKLGLRGHNRLLAVAMALDPKDLQ